MLKFLAIKNLVLIESAHLDFQGGLTALTGETGAGKSAILKALGFSLGARADLSLIRRGCEKGRVEATFAIASLPHVSTLLEEAGIEQGANEELIITRELPGRAFVNQQVVQTSFLKKLATSLLDVVGQSANIRLTSPLYQLETIDLYGNLENLRFNYHASYKHCQKLEEKITLFENRAGESSKREEKVRKALDEIATIDPKEGEEEALFQEYITLTHAQELAQLSTTALDLLEGEGGALTQLIACQKQLKRIGELDSKSSEKPLESILVEVSEVAYELKSYKNHLEHNPHHLANLQTRLSAIEGLKKQYGDDLFATWKALEEELERLSCGEETLEELKKVYVQERKKLTNLAKELTEKRTSCAKKLAKATCSHLRPLNLKEAKFDILISKGPLGPFGADNVEFTFAPNLGEGSLPVRKCASGGELSRLLLALKTALTGLEKTPTLIFDEIDSGMGGETATLVGQKLKGIATGRQVLCITHLAQVAKQADHHFAIVKKGERGRTLTHIHPISGELRKEELARMQGERGLELMPTS